MWGAREEVEKERCMEAYKEKRKVKRYISEHRGGK